LLKRHGADARFRHAAPLLWSEAGPAFTCDCAPPFWSHCSCRFPARLTTLLGRLSGNHLRADLFTLLWSLTRRYFGRYRPSLFGAPPCMRRYRPRAPFLMSKPRLNLLGSLAAFLMGRIRVGVPGSRASLLWREAVLSLSGPCAALLGRKRSTSPFRGRTALFGRTFHHPLFGHRSPLLWCGACGPRLRGRASQLRSTPSDNAVATVRAIDQARTIGSIASNPAPLRVLPALAGTGFNRFGGRTQSDGYQRANPSLLVCSVRFQGIVNMSVQPSFGALPRPSHIPNRLSARAA
jgi:hypothetical protein